MPTKKRTRRMERRSTERADARLSMRVEGTPDDGQPAQIVTETQNISASGVYCSSSHYLAPLSKVALTIVLPPLPGRRGAQRLLKCEGIVVRCLNAASRARAARLYELACSFLGLDERHRRMLEEFVAWRNLESLRAAARPVRRAASRPARAVASGTRKSATRSRVSVNGRSTRSRRTVH